MTISLTHLKMLLMISYLIYLFLVYINFVKCQKYIQLPSIQTTPKENFQHLTA